jgi:PAS domain S-box-containing protein
VFEKEDKVIAGKDLVPKVNENGWIGDVDSTGLPVVLIDCQGNILKHNAMAKRLNLMNGSGYAKFYDLFSGGDVELINSYLKLLSNHQTSLIAKTKNYDISFQSYWDDGQTIIRAIFSKEEVTIDKCNSYKELRRVLDTETDVFLLLDIDGNLLDCNTAFLLNYKLTKKDIIGKYVFDYFPENIREMRLKKFKESINSMKVVSLVDERDGLFFESNVIPIIGEKYIVDKVIVKARDITDRKKLEFENKIKNELFRSVFRNFSEAVLIADPIKKKNLFFNKKAYEELGYTKEEFSKHYLSDFDALYTSDQIKRLREHTISKGHSSYESKLKKKNGDIMEVQIDEHSIAMNNRTFIIFKWVDITEYNLAREAIETTEERLRLAIGIAHVGLWDWNIETDEVYWSDEVYSIVGVEKTRTNIIKSWKNIIHPDDLRFVIRAALKASKTGNSYTLHLRLVRHDDHSIRIIKTYGKYYLNEKNLPCRMIGTIQDITEEKKNEIKMKNLIKELQYYNETVLHQVEELNEKNRQLKSSEEQLIELNKNKDKFFSIIAHDLKSPISGFINLSEMISRDFNQLSLAEMREMAYSLHKSSGNIGKLLENLLDWARINRGVMDFNPNNYELYTYVEEVINQCYISAKQKRIKIDNSIPQEFMIYADIQMLRTILRNLVSNAIKFSYRNSSINISSQIERDNIILSVADNGVGIDETTQKHLFGLEEKFSIPGTEDEQGSGLGLIVCNELIKINGGKIWVESQPENGSTFFVSLPMGK